LIDGDVDGTGGGGAGCEDGGGSGGSRLAKDCCMAAML